MVKIVHELRRTKKSGDGLGLFCLTNKQGDSFSIAPNDYSKYQGFIVNEKHNSKNNYFKVIDSIKLLDAGELIEIHNYFDRVERIYKNEIKEIFRISKQGLIYSIQNYSGRLIIELDIRENHDYDFQGRIYSHKIEDNKLRLITHYKKYSDDSCNHLNYEGYLVILGAKNPTIINNWVEKNYWFDEKRKDSSNLWVNQAYELKIKGAAHLVFSFANHLTKAKEKSELIAKNISTIIKENKDELSLMNKNSFVQNVAISALNQLKISREEEKRERLIAGLPWFNQTWIRDELISLKAMIIEGKYEFVKNTILDYFEQYHKHGFKAMSEGIGLESKDSAVWLVKRTLDLLLTLQKKKKIKEYLSDHELGFFREKTKYLGKKLLEQYPDQLISCDYKETWMDTISRGKYPLEVQLVFPLIYELEELLCKLTKHKSEFKKLKDSKKNLKKLYFKQGLLADNLDENKNPDFLMRPNVFLSYYLCPELLIKKEWEQVFDHAIRKLWLSYGAFSTVDKNSNLFKEEHSGTNNVSYHNGDSWFYINNLAAVCMVDLSMNRFAGAIKHIMNASSNDLLFNGCLAASSEISSANNQGALGCFNQAWSNATLIELLDKL